MTRSFPLPGECRYRFCHKTCEMPSWKYRCDNCHRLENNARAVDKKNKKKKNGTTI